MLAYLGPALLTWALLVLARRWWSRRARPAAVRFSSLHHVRHLRRSPTLWMRRAVAALRWLVLLLLLVALLRPQTGRKLTEVSTEGIDIVLVMDTSGSMQALDLDADERSLVRRRNRLEVAKDVVEEFVDARVNDQIGLVVFGENAFTQCPLTLDHGILKTFLERLEIGMAGDATAIGSAVGTAVKRLQDSEATSKVVVLLTDGRSNAGSLSPLTAAEIAATLGVKIYAIGAGTRGEAPFLVETRLGPRPVYENVEIDEETLTAMAERTGGAYFRAEDEGALAEIYAQIDELERTEITMESFMEYDEEYPWLVVPALLLLVLEMVLLNTRLRTLP
ncbi:MAG: VWA domain-containing protein [Acidobacteria bacterium]|nr:MAG: VWA domain-containing protein [Acidobacteriota bacterium]REK00319.1 MAG: VWA domain-containing protein [Acidobacteriota bacterium]